MGSGSGYLTAVMSHMVRQRGNASEAASEHASSGKVVGIEHIAELTQGSLNAVEDIPFARQQLHDGSLIFITVSPLPTSAACILQLQPCPMLT